MDYLELTINIQPREPWAEILVSQLAELGFESFVDTETGVLAYAQVTEIDLENAIKESILASESEEFELDFESKIIPQQNWNALWEADFQPVEVEDRMTILAPFHDKSNAKGIIVEIQPQMSFGTGHHQTTWMMSKALLDLPEVPKTVLDMGTGTGVLAILAEKLGAENILAIDIEDWSVENTKENALRNGAKGIVALHGDIDLVEGKTFDLILANINKNILKSHLNQYSNSLLAGGMLMLSGFFETDVDELATAAKNENLTLQKVLNKETWAAMILTKDKEK
jgi:ribosomal protein L11 methyltransferase